MEDKSKKYDAKINNIEKMKNYIVNNHVIN